MSEDPKLFDAGDYNLYRYCHNDPLDMTDPMGDWAVPPAEWVQQQLQKLARQAQDLAERVQSTVESEHTPNANAMNQQRWGSIQQGLAQVRNDFKVVYNTKLHEGADKQLRPGQMAKTEASLGKPIGKDGANGVIARQTLNIDAYFAKNLPWKLRGKEMSNVFSLQSWAEDEVPRIVAPLGSVHFATPAAAAEAMDAVVRPSFGDIYYSLKLKDSPLGENIIHE